MKKRVYCLLLFTTMLFAANTQAFAQTEKDMVNVIEAVDNLTTKEDSEISLLYEDLITLSSSLSISSGGRATCTGVAQTRSSTSHIKMDMELLQKVGSKWVEVDSWSTTGKPGENISFNKNYSGLSSGYSYKVTTSVKVYNGSKLVESDSIDSTIQSYK